MSIKSNYRPDIDGLRAVAVVSVVLFHAGLEWLPGGFVGVDVFFVISGFLITRIIVSHQGSMGDFARSFYERRVRRLVPPAVPVLVFASAFGWYILPPAALQEYAQSLLSYTVFVSNWFFLSIAGYFDGPSHFKPLLHTWSLSIEEQFYLLFPFPILLAKKYGPGAVAVLLIAIFAFSFGYSTYLVNNGNTDAAFYNSFARFWEIALGGLIAVGVLTSPRHRLSREVMGVTGLGLIVASVLLYDTRIPFPGPSALVPAAGAAMLILSTDGYANRALSWRPVAGLGLISYAIYLWHWPILVFIQYSVIGFTHWHLLAGAGASVALAAVSYYAIETPVRRGILFQSPRRLAGAFAIICATCLGSGALVWQEQGVPERFPQAAEYAANLTTMLQEHSEKRLRSVCWLANEDFLEATERCLDPQPGKTNVLLIGDSHAAQFYPALSNRWPGGNVDLLASDSCALQITDRIPCNELTNWLLDETRDGVFDYQEVLIVSRISKQGTIEGFAQYAKKIASHGIKTTVLGPIQHYLPGLPTMFPVMSGATNSEPMLDAFDRAVQSKQFEYDQYLRQTLKDTAVHYISLLDVTCPAGSASCQHLDDRGLPITLDATHLTLEAADSIIERIAPQLYTTVPHGQ